MKIKPVLSTTFLLKFSEFGTQIRDCGFLFPSNNRKTVIPQITNMAMKIITSSNGSFSIVMLVFYSFLGCNTIWNLKLQLMEEILHRLIGSLPHYLQGFIHPRWCRISSTNSMIESPPKSWDPLGWSAYLGFLFEANHVDKCVES